MKMDFKQIVAITFTAIPLLAGAQGATDVFKMSQNELRGTARFMSMAGAFGALGGDLSVLDQNPGGIGVYRSSDIGITVDFDSQSANEKITHTTTNQFKVTCNNFGYIGAMKLDSDVMPNINWGISYSRPMSFNRHYSGHINQLRSSLSNYIANYTNDERWASVDLDNRNPNEFDPYYETNAPWMSILAANNYLINPNSNDFFHGLFNSNSTGSGEYDVEETGGVDQFNINWGGNIANIVYWGMGFGITNLDYKATTYYGESIDNAQIRHYKDHKDQQATIPGYAEYGVVNSLHTYGSGCNFKLGVIVKPINEFRIGLSFHTPTYYSLKDESIAYVSAEYTPDIDYDANIVQCNDRTNQGYLGEFWYKIRTPWRYIASAAAVIGGKGILSFDYERQDYSGIEYRDDNGRLDLTTKTDIKNYYKDINIYRVGAEYRITPQFSIRAGYSFQESPVTDRALNGDEAIYTGSTTPAYIFDKSTQYITAGIGYRYKNFYADMAYVHKQRDSEYHAFSPYTHVGEFGESTFIESPTARLTEKSNKVVVTLGVRF